MIFLKKNKFFAADELELLMPGKAAQPLCLGTMENEAHESIELANVPHMTVYAKLPFAAPPMSILRRKK